MKSNYLHIGFILVTFFFISFLTNIVGPIIPEIIRDYELSLTLVSLLPFSFFIAYGLFSIPSGLLIERYGEKKTIIIAWSLSLIGSLLFVLVSNYLSAIGGLFFIGSGMAMLQVAINPLLQKITGTRQFAFYSILGQLFFGLASFLSPLFYTWIVGKNHPWQSIYWVFAVVSFILALITGIWKFPVRGEDAGQEKQPPLQTYLTLLKNPKTILYFMAVFAYVGSEQGVANWISEYLYQFHQQNPLTAGAKTVSLFWGLMTAGTFVGLILVKYIESRKVLATFTVAALVCLGVALFGNTRMSLIAFPAIGFFEAVMWPVIISMGLNSVNSNQGALSGILITGICGGAVVPLIIGAISDHSNLKTGLCFLFITLGYILITACRPQVQPS